MDRKSFSNGIRAGFGALALAVVPGSAFAQEAETRLGWQPYLGCWAQPAHLVEVDRPEGEEADEGVLCFVASGSDVEMLTIANGVITHREPFPADGQPRTVEQDGCRGTETARFSDDQRRIYTTSEATCEDGALRRSTGIISMPSLSEWLDVRAMEVDGRATAWSQWYQRTSTDVLEDLGIESGQFETPLAVRGASMYAAARIMIDDVIDASMNAHPKAVEAWLAEVGQPFARLDAEQLVRLADAGVPGGVIDVVVAVSFPERFALNRQDAYADRGDAIYPRTVWLQRDYGPFGYGYMSRYGYYSPYGYYGSRYGGGYWGGGYYGWGGGYYTPVVVDVTRTERQGGGRVIAGRGYSGGRSTARGPARSAGGAWMGGSAGYRGSGAAVSSGGGSGGSRSARPRGGSSGSSRPSISGTSSRSGGSSSGRTARRRGGSS
ncbi:MAG: hypothetical protein F4Y24_17915 [Gemmatimonadetes bacterium]|nr:hypothetical protein [Gemmatimonadota bacterium]MYG24050.1 hypothetical protein [Gemmatimonadota bacterium]MYJ38963.1 hypothetical protein [Gemmatimonadota bacterium]